MSCSLKVIVSATLFILISECTVGQKIRFYNAEHELPNSLIHRVSQDAQGYIWIATENGASYFDGRRFTTFRHEDNKPGTISSDLIKVVFTDSQGVTWVGTDDGLQTFDHQRNLFIPFPLHIQQTALKQYVTSIAESPDHQKRFVSISAHGIEVYHNQTHQFDQQTTTWLNNLFPTKYLGILFFDAQGNLWAHSEQGLFLKVNFSTQRLEPIMWDANLTNLAEKVVVASLTQDPVTQNILVGTYNHGLFIYDAVTKQIRRPKGATAAKYRIRALLAETSDVQNPSPDIWVGTEDSGLKKFDRQTEEVITPDYQYAPIDLNSCKIHSLAMDKQRNIWAGVFQKGLLVIPKSANPFNYLKITDMPGSMSVNIACVTSIVRDKNHALWVGTDGGGVFRVNPDGSKTRFTSQNSPLPNNAILSLVTDNQNNVWASTYMGGLTVYNPATGFRLFSNAPELQKVNNAIYDSMQQKIYFGTLGHGVRVLAHNQKTTQPFPANETTGWTSALCIDHNQNLWIGKTDGLNCYNTLTGTEQYTSLIALVQGNQVTSLMVLNDTTIGLGSSSGLFLLHLQNNTVTRYTKADGLAASLVCALQSDTLGNLWISTMKGLSKFDPNTKTFTNFYAYDGLQDNEFRVRASFSDADGQLFFGGINGVSHFYPQHINNNEKLSAKLLFSQLRVLNQPVQYNEALGKKNTLDRHISQAKNITLKKNQNVFTLEFGVLEFSNPQKVVYGYMLKGFDTDWRYTNMANPAATYTNLPAGHYVFKVKAFFEGNPQNMVANQLNIRILPPWYQTWWAYLLYAILLTLAVLEVRTVYNRRKIRLNEQLELERKELKLRMFTDLSHEIRTPFTMVLNPLKTMRETETDSKRKEMFDLMHRNMLRVLRLLNQLIDMRKIDNNLLKLSYQKTDLVFFIRDIMQSFDQLATMRNIDFRLVATLESLEVNLDQANFDKVVFNILSNAFKFTPDNGYILIHLDTLPAEHHESNRSHKAQMVSLCIENSGPQINENELERIFDRFYQSDNNTIGGSGIGLHLAKMIITLHGGTITAKNKPHGVCFTLQIPMADHHSFSTEKSGAKTTSGILESVYQNKPLREADYVEMPAPDDDLAYAVTGKLKRTLVFVDDDAELGKYIRMELSDKYHVEVFTDAPTAWKLISTTIPDVVVTDLIMKEMDGGTLCRKIRQNQGTNHIPVIILTSQTDEESKQMCIEYGADQFLTKPIGLDFLRSTIAQVVQTRDTIKNKFTSEVKPDFESIKLNSPDSKLMAKVVETIRKNIENPEFSVDDLSREVGLSRVHLNRKLKENINISPSNLIKSIRLKQAAYLLINNKVNVSDIAYIVGFSSPSYFSNNFKEYFGMVPTEFVLKYNDPAEKENLNKLFETW